MKLRTDFSILHCLFSVLAMSQIAWGDPIPVHLRVKRSVGRALYPIEYQLPGRLRPSYRKKALEFALFSASHGLAGGLLATLIFQSPSLHGIADSQASWTGKLRQLSSLRSLQIGVAAGSLHGVQRYRSGLFHKAKIEAILRPYSLTARAKAISKPLLKDQRYWMMMEVFSHLVTEAEDLYPESQSYLWDLIVMENDDLNTANAHSWAGGVFAIDSGILKLAQTKSAVAAILGHEIGHTLAQHAAMQIKLMAFANEVISPLNIPFMILGVQQRWKAPLIAYLPFTRKYEREADLIGLVLMARAGYDPFQAIEFWNKMGHASASTNRPFFSTHPHPEDRRTELALRIPEVLPLCPGELQSETELPED